MNRYIYRQLLIPATLILWTGKFYSETRMIFEAGRVDENNLDEELNVLYFIFFVMLQTNFIIFEQSTGWIDVVAIVVAFFYYYIKVRAVNVSNRPKKEKV